MKLYLGNYRFWIAMAILLVLGFFHDSRFFSLNISPFIAAGLTRYTIDRILFLAIIIFAAFKFGKNAGITFAIIALSLMLPNAIFLASSWFDALIETLTVIATGLLTTFFIDLRNRNITEIITSREHILGLSRRLIAAQEAEQERIGQELHDSAGQSLTVLSLAIQHLRKLPPEELSPALEEVENILQETVKDIRDLSHLLKPPLLENSGLIVALDTYFEQLRNRNVLEVEFTHKETSKHFPKELETVIFRIIQEALTNVSRHSGVKNAKVAISILENELILGIADSGIGFDYNQLSGRSLGLRGMQERTELLGGTFMVDSNPGKGTRINARFPLIEDTQVRLSGIPRKPTGP